MAYSIRTASVIHHRVPSWLVFLLCGQSFPSSLDHSSMPQPFLQKTCFDDVCEHLIKVTSWRSVARSLRSCLLITTTPSIGSFQNVEFFGSQLGVELYTKEHKKHATFLCTLVQVGRYHARRLHVVLIIPWRGSRDNGHHIFFLAFFPANSPVGPKQLRSRTPQPLTN